MAAYLIADVEVNDPQAYAEYRRRFDPILERFGGGGSWSPVDKQWR